MFSRSSWHGARLAGSWAIALGVTQICACSAGKQVGDGPIAKPASALDQEEADADGDGEEELSLEEVLKQCGVDQDDLDDEDKVIFEKTIRSWPKSFTGQQAAPIVGNVNYIVNVTTVIKIKSTVSQSEQEVDFEIQATPSKAEGPAREKTAPNAGTTVQTILSADERAELMGQSGDWDGVVCTIQPVRELSTNKGGKGKVVKFDPPLPGSISPKADPARYAAEIGDGRTFSNIHAKVTGSSDPDMPKGKKLTGSVTITPVPSQLRLDIGGKDSRTISADLAYKIEYDFGSVAETVALGLMPSQTMYITHSKRDIKAIVADTGFKEGGMVVLIDGLQSSP